MTELTFNLIVQPDLDFIDPKAVTALIEMGLVDAFESDPERWGRLDTIRIEVTRGPVEF